LSSDSLQLAGRVALITGASKGIGKAVAQRLAVLGAHVVVNYSRDAKAADEVVAAARACGVKALAVRADVSLPEEVAALVAKTIAEFERIDIPDLQRRHLGRRAN